MLTPPQLRYRPGPTFTAQCFIIAALITMLSFSVQAQEGHEQHMEHSAHKKPAIKKTSTEASTSETMDHSKHMDHSEHQGHGAKGGHGAHNMTLDRTGMVMNSNVDKLPRDCQSINREYEFTVYAGREYAKEFPGSVFGLSQHEYQVEPCSRITVTFINKDDIRHQWMVHGLPKYLYPKGMFHLEAAGGQQQTATFIVPSDHKTYLVHCDMAQHMEKGMKAQLLVGRGSGDLWSIPGVSSDFKRSNYLPPNSLLFFLLASAVAFLITIWLGARTNRQ